MNYRIIEPRIPPTPPEPDYPIPEPEGYAKLWTLLAVAFVASVVGTKPRNIVFDPRLAVLLMSNFALSPAPNNDPETDLIKSLLMASTYRGQQVSNMPNVVLETPTTDNVSDWQRHCLMFIVGCLLITLGR